MHQKVITTLPTNIDRLISHHFETSKNKNLFFHTRSNNRGGVFRLQLDNTNSVFVKAWLIKNLKEKIKSTIHMSNGWREWNIHNYIYKKEITVPKPLHFTRILTSSKKQYEIMVIEDLGTVQSSLQYLKELIRDDNKTQINIFENNLITTTKQIHDIGITDIDHQLNNFVVNDRNQLIRIDFECAKRCIFANQKRNNLAEMLSRLLATHAYATQPNIQATEKFAAQLYHRLNIKTEIRSFIQNSVNKKLRSQPTQPSISNSIDLPF